MSLTVKKDNCTLEIVWPSSCCAGINRDTLRFIVVVYDVEGGYRMVTAPLSARSLTLLVAVPPYFSSSAGGLVVTVHLCHALINEVGWKTMKSLRACTVSFGDGHYESGCEHGPCGMKCSHCAIS